MKKLYKPNGELLKKWLQDNHYSYAVFAKDAGLKSVGTVNAFCNNKRPTTDKTLRKIHMLTQIDFNLLIIPEDEEITID